MSEPCSSRKSESSHHFQALEGMIAQGIFSDNSSELQKDSKTLCREYLNGNRQTIKSFIFSSTQFSNVLKRVRNLNESRIQRDVTPWIVPSAENLIVCGEPKTDYNGNELNAE